MAGGEREKENIEVVTRSTKARGAEYIRRH
jgi:hypothetical protein